MKFGFSGFRGASMALLGMVLALPPLALTPTVAEAAERPNVRASIVPQTGTLASAIGERDCPDGEEGECTEKESAEESKDGESKDGESEGEESKDGESKGEESNAEEPAEETKEEESTEEPEEAESSDDE